MMAAYLGALEATSRAGLDARLSIKAPAFGFSPELLAKLLKQARSAGCHVHFDSLSWESAEPTLALIAEAASPHDQLGITLPARWSRSLADAEAAIELGLSVRLVKGRWPDLGNGGPGPVRAASSLWCSGWPGAPARSRWPPTTSRSPARHSGCCARPGPLASSSCCSDCRRPRPPAPQTSSRRRSGSTCRMATQRFRTALRTLGGTSESWAGSAQDLLQGRRKGWRGLSGQRGLGALPLGLADETAAAPSGGSRARA